MSLCLEVGISCGGRCKGEFVVVCCARFYISFALKMEKNVGNMRRNVYFCGRILLNVLTKVSHTDKLAVWEALK